ncbi:hypothetical protein [Pedobacter paludis]|uniref:Uncharacterized protein n=1 Tax=Pedobacter paludis TaxID=2203212 RepID=A0A317ETP3_9SPHI|nr:hypothetical protein [Pedobacter paludis]PWS29815.1 hypothetical protein DF947_20985 [Pedobacter paludis]
MKKLFFLLMLAVVGIANAKAQKSTIGTLFPNKTTEELKLQKPKVQAVSKDVSTPTKQRLFQNYTPAVQKTRINATQKGAQANEKMASDTEKKEEKKEAKSEVKMPPMQQETGNKQ